MRSAPKARRERAPHRASRRAHLSTSRRSLPIRGSPRLALSTKVSWRAGSAGSTSGGSRILLPARLPSKPCSRQHEISLVGRPSVGGVRSCRPPTRRPESRAARASRGHRQDSPTRGECPFRAADGLACRLGPSSRRGVVRARCAPVAASVQRFPAVFSRRNAAGRRRRKTSAASRCRGKRAREGRQDSNLQPRVLEVGYRRF
jgi:hypothetical protein